MSAILPPRIERGQTLGVIAPAGPVRTIRLQRGLERLGDAFRIQLAPSLVGDTAGGVVAGPALDRKGNPMTLLLKGKVEPYIDGRPTE